MTSLIPATRVVAPVVQAVLSVIVLSSVIWTVVPVTVRSPKTLAPSPLSVIFPAEVKVVLPVATMVVSPF